MICHGLSIIGSHVSYLHSLGEAAAAREVQLHDVDVALQNQPPETVAAALLFTGGNANIGSCSQFLIPGVVVSHQGFFQPEDVVIGKSAGAMNGGFRVPYQA